MTSSFLASTRSIFWPVLEETAPVGCSENHTFASVSGDVSCLPKNGNAEAELPGGLTSYFETLKFENKPASQNPSLKIERGLSQENERERNMIELAILCDRMDNDGSGALSLQEMLDAGG